MSMAQTFHGTRTQARLWSAAGVLVLAVSLAPATLAQTAAEPVHVVTYLDVGTTAVAQGVELVGKLRDAGRRAPGNLEFIALQEMSRPNRFVIVETWQDKAALEQNGKVASSIEIQASLKSLRNSPPDPHLVQAFADQPVLAAPAAGALYMVEHVDFIGGDPNIASTSAPLIKALAEASQKEPGIIRYDVYRQPPPRLNHYEVVAAWPDRKAFDAHETAAHTLKYRAATAKGGAWRVNLYDMRLYRAL
jgi:quinol monooxygenase YgiN